MSLTLNDDIYRSSMKQFHERSSQEKSNEMLSCLDTRIASVPYNKYGKHLLLTRLKITSSDAERQTLLRMALSDVKTHF